MTTALEIRDLRLGFPTGNGGWKAVVDGVSLAVSAGERVGLVGESGSGKSLTALACLGLVPAPGRVLGGLVRIAGRDLAGLGPAELASIRGGQVGLVLQEAAAALNPVYTVGYQIAETARCHRKLSRAAARAEARRLLEELGFDTPDPILAAYPHQLSGGQAQRAMLAAALAGEPALLLADEPTTGLDVTAQARLLAVLARVADQRDLALLVISHDLSVVAGLCSRIAVMFSGEIVEEAPTRMLLERPRHPYTRLLLDAHPSRRVPGAAAPPAAVTQAHARPVQGCRFAPRCDWTRQECTEHHPAMEAAGDGMVRCPVRPFAARRGESSS